MTKENNVTSLLEKVIVVKHTESHVRESLGHNHCRFMRFLRFCRICKPRGMITALIVLCGYRFSLFSYYIDIAGLSYVQKLGCKDGSAIGKFFLSSCENKLKV
jgi:hypothetical protein